MIGSFWNLCRACPSMPVDKLHSEYRSTYRWHEYTGNLRQEVVRKPPNPNNFGQSNEPYLPRRKKCPELAYKTHEFIGMDDKPTGINTSTTRARSEGRDVPSRRSKSEDPIEIVNGKSDHIDINDGIGDSSKQAGESNGLFKKTFSKLSTEYRLQFVWPHVRRVVKGQTNDNVDFPRKSQSMNAIKSTQSNALPTIHKKRTTKRKEATFLELEPLVTDKKGEKEQSQTKNQPLEQQQQRPNQFITKKENFGFSDDFYESKNLVNGTTSYNDEWLKEVIELRKKAGEYKFRGWGVEIAPDLQRKQKDLWDQVSKRSSLSALSLASSVHRPITKEEKDEENNKKSSKTKPFGKIVIAEKLHAVDTKQTEDVNLLPTRTQTIRHHLERTTGHVNIEEGVLLPSPTREKLMPAIPKQKDQDSYSSQRGSPKKSETSRNGSPQKGSPKKTPKGRSQSVGPSVNTNESPKRQVRCVSSIPPAAKTPKTPNAYTIEKSSKSHKSEASVQEKPGITTTTNSHQNDNEISENIVKSPPEPTRVKSPEQILTRSPDPVNWTVPLDTGKTFTVTQNVKDEFYNRPQSEFKASTPIEKPPPAPQSAPPELTEQSKMETNNYISLY